MTTYDIVLWSVLSGPLVYLVAILVSPTPVSRREYHYASRRLEPQEYVDTTLMYALQVAAIALFATWGYLYGLSAVLVPLFWGLGYLIIAHLVRTGRLDEFIRSDSFGTLHQFIGWGGKYPVVSKLAAVLTLLAISGPAMFEAFFTASVVERTLASQGGISASALAVLFLAFSTIYMLRGGYTGAVRLDRIQLATGYLAFVALAAGLLLSVSKPATATPVIALSFVLVGCTVTIFVGRWRHGRLVGRRDSFGMACTGVAALCALTPLGFAITLHGASDSMVSLRSVLFPDTFSPLAILSLLVANALYQLVDVGQWQRLLSLNPFTQGNERARDIVIGSLKNIAVASPLTWVIAIVFGATLKTISVDADAYQATYLLVDHILSLQPLAKNVLLTLLMVSLVAIMLSTIDALVSATGFTITNDIFGRNPDNSPKLAFDRIVTLITLVTQLAFYLVVKKLSGDKTDAVLYLCWSFQIAFAPSVWAALSRRDFGQPALLASLCIGILAAVGPLLALGPDSVYEYSPWCALVGAVAGLYAPVLFNRANKTI